MTQNHWPTQALLVAFTLLLPGLTYARDAATSPPATHGPARAKAMPPVVLPGKGVGPFVLGMSQAAFLAMGTRHTPIDSSGWTRVATDEGSDLTTYQLRFEKEELQIIDFRISRSAVGLRIGSRVFHAGEPRLLAELQKALSCGKIEYAEGGNSIPCASPPGTGQTVLRQGMELDCSLWVTINAAPACTATAKQKEFLELRIAK